MRPCLGLGEACARLVGVLAAVIHPTDVRHPDLEHVGICTVQPSQSENVEKPGEGGENSHAQQPGPDNRASASAGMVLRFTRIEPHRGRISVELRYMWNGQISSCARDE